MSINGIKAKNINFDSFSITDGLPNKSVWAITEDKQGFLWIGTSAGLTRYDGYNFKTYTHDSENNSSLTGDIITTLHKDDEGKLWVGTSDSGLNLRTNNGFQSFVHNTNTENSILSNNINSISSTTRYLWIGTDLGLNYFDKEKHVFKKVKLDFNGSEDTFIKNVYRLNADTVLVGTNNSIYKIDASDLTTEKLEFQLADTNSTVFRTFHKDASGTLWAGTNDGLYRFDDTANSFLIYSDTFKKIPILNIISDELGVWVGTYKKGLYLIAKDNSIKNYSYDANNSQSLRAENVTYHYKDRSGRSWVGSFQNGLNTYLSQSAYFDTKNYSNGLDCLAAPAIYSIYVTGSNVILGTPQGMYSYNENTQLCKRLDKNQKQKSQYNYFEVKNIQAFSEHELVISSNNGLNIFNLKTGEITDFPTTTNSEYTYFLVQLNNNRYLQGTSKGLFLLDPSDKSLELISDVARFYDYAASENGSYYFATSTGISSYSSSGIFKNTDIAKLKDIIDISINGSELWISNEHNSIDSYDLTGKLLKNYKLPKTKPVVIYSLEHHDDDLWVSTSNGVYKINKSTKSIVNFTEFDGLQGNLFSENATFKTSDGKLYLGGGNGYNTFYPENLYANQNHPKVTLSKLLRFNKEVIVKKDYSGFSISQPVEKISSMELGYKDYVIGFEFTALHYADPSRNKYAYMLEGLHNEWTYTDAKNRLATFTNLKPGKYAFKVKASNKDGLWSKDIDDVSLPILVHPAPWLSWWAFLLYFFGLVAGISLLTIYRTRAAVTRSKELKNEVKARTQEIQQQKEVIELLMERKDKLFANISHEFRTPLTLILGPLENELKSLNAPKNPKQLRIIQRNAQRLLGMVEQILKLTELNNADVNPQNSYSIDRVLEAIVNSFQALANSKEIYLSLETNSNKNVLVTHDALDIIFGNLLSNAIKYTHKGGNVSIRTQAVNNMVRISVEDTGVGMNQNQQNEIFERFTRLDKTSDIAGTGIGLSIVKELVSSHNGFIKVNSTEGKGSQFIITLPSTDIAAPIDSYSVRSIEHLTYVERETTLIDNDELEYENTISSKNLILIIDDSLDMREYISHVLSIDYKCMNADCGSKGISLAKQYVPDLIICDVMMPEMGGYEVARKLREDVVTSHIPLMLLTAKGDMQSRISGWNENIDDYMTKPFNEVELLARADSLISVRNILSQKVANSISNDNLRNIDAIEEKPKVLNKKEQYFLDKFMQIIENNYNDEFFRKTNMTTLMFVSERQLQRKIKALTNQSPMEILKDFRLNRASQYLMDGETVSKVMEMCGFSSASHFSRSFKAKYNLSPKQYQLQN